MKWLSSSAPGVTEKSEPLCPSVWCHQASSESIKRVTIQCHDACFMLPRGTQFSQSLSKGINFLMCQVWELFLEISWVLVPKKEGHSRLRFNFNETNAWDNSEEFEKKSLWGRFYAFLYASLCTSYLGYTVEKHTAYTFKILKTTFYPWEKITMNTLFKM